VSGGDSDGDNDGHDEGNSLSDHEGEIDYDSDDLNNKISVWKSQVSFRA
jgi:hypothetical protein